MAYIGTSPSNGVRRRFVYEATASQTSFSGNDENGVTLTYVDSLYLDVYQNGIKLKAGDDYTATTGTSVVLVQGASVNDVVEMVAFDVFSVNDSVSASAGGGFAGNISSPIVTGSTSLRTPLIEFTDGDDAIAIADGGVVTLLTTAVAKSEGGAVTTNIAQGLCKHWIDHNDGATVNDSFNNTSLTDGGTGDYTATIANDFSNTLYAKSITVGGTSGAAGDDCYGGASGVATGSYSMYAREAAGTNNDNRKDSELSSMSAWGDLA